MNQRQVMLLQSGKRSIAREWGLRKVFLSLQVCVLAMVAGQGCAQEITAETEAQWVKAAEQGHVKAQYDLATYYECSVSANYVEAVIWCRKAAAQGHAGAKVEMERLN